MAWVFGLMQKYGCIDYGRRCARELAGAALPPSEHKRVVEQVIMYMIDRDL